MGCVPSREAGGSGPPTTPRGTAPHASSESVKRSPADDLAQAPSTKTAARDVLEASGRDDRASDAYPASSSRQASLRRPTRQNSARMLVQLSRDINMFLCSTFRDMHSERDHLQAHIFPTVIERCARRQVRFHVRDLRWGVTAEESADGQVILRCLQEVERCRPFLIAILGMEYGWCHDDDPDSAALALEFENATKEHPWVASLTDRSITEIEITHAFLRQPKEKRQGCRFYFKVPPRGYVPQTQAAVKLADLKQRLIEAGANPRYYNTDDELGEGVLSDVMQLVDRVFPAAKKVAQRSAVAQPRHESTQKMRDTELLTRQARRLFGDAHAGRSWNLMEYYVTMQSSADAISTFLRSTAGSQCLCIAGPTGCGKSTLVASLLGGDRVSDLSCNALLHHVGATANSANYANAALHFMLWCKSTMGLNRALPVAAQTTTNDSGERIAEYELIGVGDPASKSVLHAFREWVQVACDTAASHGKKLVFVIDGVDAERLDEIAELVNFELPDNFMFIFTTTIEAKDAHMDGGVRSRAPSLSEDPTSGGTASWDLMTLAPLTKPERVQFLQQLLFQSYGKKLTKVQQNKIVSCERMGNPLALKLLCHELIKHARFEELDAKMEELLAHSTIEELYGAIIARLSREHGKKLVERLMGFVCISRFGLSTHEMRGLLKLPLRTFSDLWAQAHDLFVPGDKSECGDVLFCLASRKIDTVVRRKLLSNPSMVTRLHLFAARFFDEAYPAYIKPTGRVVEAVFHLHEIRRSFPDQLLAKLSDLSLLPMCFAPRHRKDYLSWCRSAGGGRGYAKVLDRMLSVLLPLNAADLAACPHEASRALMRVRIRLAQSTPLLSGRRPSDVDGCNGMDTEGAVAHVHNLWNIFRDHMYHLGGERCLEKDKCSSIVLLCRRVRLMQQIWRVTLLVAQFAREVGEYGVSEQLLVKLIDDADTDDRWDSHVVQCEDDNEPLTPLHGGESDSHPGTAPYLPGRLFLFIPQLEQAYVHIDLAELYFRHKVQPSTIDPCTGEPAKGSSESERLLSRGLEVAEKLRARKKSGATALLAEAYHRLGVRRLVGRGNDSSGDFLTKSLFQLALCLWDVLENPVQRAQSLNGIGSLMMKQGRWDEAKRHLLQCLEIRTSMLHSTHPDQGQIHSTLGTLHLDMAQAFADRGQVQTFPAGASYDSSVFPRSPDAPKSPVVKRVASNTPLHIKTGIRSVPSSPLAVPPKPPLSSPKGSRRSLRRHRSMTYYESREKTALARAIWHFSEAKRVYVAALGASHPRCCHALDGLAQALRKVGNVDAAVEQERQAARIRDSGSGLDLTSIKPNSIVSSKSSDAGDTVKTSVTLQPPVIIRARDTPEPEPEPEPEPAPDSETKEELDAELDAVTVTETYGKPKLEPESGSESEPETMTLSLSSPVPVPVPPKCEQTDV